MCVPDDAEGILGTFEISHPVSNPSNLVGP